MSECLQRLWTEDDGQDLAEYSLILTFIVATTAALVGYFKPSIAGIWTSTNNQLSAGNVFAAGS